MLLLSLKFKFCGGAQSGIDGDTFVKDKAFAKPVCATDLLEVFQYATIQLKRMIDSTLSHIKQSFLTSNAASAKRNEGFILPDTPWESTVGTARKGIIKR